MFSAFWAWRESIACLRTYIQENTDNFREWNLCGICSSIDMSPPLQTLKNWQSWRSLRIKNSLWQDLSQIKPDGTTLGGWTFGVMKRGGRWGREQNGLLYGAIFPFLSVIPLSLDKHSRTHEILQLCGPYWETKDQSWRTVLDLTEQSFNKTWTGISLALYVLQCLLPPSLTVSHSLPCIFCKSRPGVFTAPPKWQNDWVMYECNSACCDVSYIMWEVRRCSRFHVCCKPTDRETLEMHCARWDVSTAVKPTKNVLFAGLRWPNTLAWDAIYCRYTNQEIRRLFFSVFLGGDYPRSFIIWAQTTVMSV